MSEQVNSTSDQRTINNAVRHTYRVLSDAEKARMQEIKDLGAAFIAKLHEIGGTEAGGDRFASLPATSLWRTPTLKMRSCAPCAISRPDHQRRQGKR